MKGKFYKWFYEEFIFDDWWDMKPIGKMVLYIPWLIRSALFYICIALFYMAYKFMDSDLFGALLDEYIKVQLIMDDIYKTFNS